MAHTRFLICFVISLFLLAGCEATNSDASVKTYVHVPPALPDSVYNLIQPGDVILRKGVGPLSFQIMNATKEEYSHCGIIVQENGVWRVIHSIGGSVNKEEEDGVQIMDLVDFVPFAADSMLYICRPIFGDSLEFKIPVRAQYYLDQRTPFDHSFSLFTKDKIYCSELLFHVFRDIHGKNVFEIRKKHKSYLLMFSTFFDAEKFIPIYDLKNPTNTRN